MAPRGTLAERTWRKVDRGGGPYACWLWTAATDGKGYGKISVGPAGAGSLRAHRVVYELLVGPIPDGLQLDHLCRNPSCVNPLHLEAVTNRENNLRGLKPEQMREYHAAKMHCVNGHPLSGDNVWWAKKKGVRDRHYMRRLCKTCSLERARRYNGVTKPRKAI